MNEILKQKFKKIFDKVQEDSSCHQKYRKVLTEVFKTTALDTFTRVFLDFLRIIIEQTTDTNVYVKRSLTFCSRFCGEITRIEEKNDDNHPFLTKVINKILKWSRAESYELRYNSCRFLTMALQDIGEDVQLEVDLIEEIQKVLLDRSKESKVQLRYQAMSALVRLQDPQNMECPVMNSYLRGLSSGSAQIRREAVIHIAPNNITVNRIKDRVRDVDQGVRCAAFHRCADIGPLVFKIVDRHMILLCGFKETNQCVRNTFYDYLLPKWLTAYKGNFLKFIGALRLIADEEDLGKLEYLSRELIKYFYNHHPINDLVSVLPTNDEKVIKEDLLTNELSLFWKILTDLLRESEDMDVYLSTILPELTPFCSYIDRVIKSKSREKMDEWKFFEYQFDLLNLLEMAEKYDFSDEVGRRALHSLTLNILQNYTFTRKVTKKIVTLSHKCSSSLEFFTNDMCQVISEIREPLLDQPLSEDQLIQKNFKMAELKFKLTLLEDQQTEAVEAKDFQKAHLLKTEMESCQQELEKMRETNDGEKVRQVKSDNETVCRCLDILISVLELPELTKTTVSLITCKDNFLVPLILNQSPEPHWRVLKCLTLFSTLDKAMAEEYAKLIAIPMATYRTIPNTNISALIQSISGVVDLISLYGIEIVGQSEDTNSNSTATTNQSVTKRKLYNSDNEENNITTIPKQDEITLSDILEILLEMLDDERDEVKHKAVFAIGALIKHGFSVTPSVISRLILKWSNPLTEKIDSRLQVGLGLLIEFYMRCKNSAQVMKEAIIPTFRSITGAPKGSPLLDIDTDNLLTLFAEIMNVGLQKDAIRILALDICMKISENLDDSLVTLLAKFLNHLDIQVDNMESAEELIDRVEMLLESIRDKSTKKHIEKFLAKLRIQKAKSREVTEEQNKNKEVTILRDANVENNIEPQQVKRKKERLGKECVVVLERFDAKRKNDTTLHTIIETSMEIDEDLIIQTPTSESSNERRNKTVISETSDSDNSGSVGRRSNRLRKKRIL